MGTRREPLQSSPSYDVDAPSEEQRILQECGMGEVRAIHKHFLSGSSGLHPGQVLKMQRDMGTKCSRKQTNTGTQPPRREINKPVVLMQKRHVP